MKIATFNINNVNKRIANLLAWLRVASPDAVCLQELKSTDADFPIQAIRRAGYHAVRRGQRTWNGVAILARDREPVLTCRELPGDPRDMESRYIEAAVSGILIGCLQELKSTDADFPIQAIRRAGYHAVCLRAERESPARAEIRLQA